MAVANQSPPGIHPPMSRHGHEMLWCTPEKSFFLGRPRVGQMGVDEAGDEIGEGSGEGAAVGTCGETAVEAGEVAAVGASEETAVGASEEKAVETGKEAAVGAV